MSRRDIRGVTLIELVVTIVILSVAVTGIVGSLSSSTVQSGNRMIQQQAAAIATSYLDEILSKPFNDPNGGSEASRNLYDNVADYASLPDTVVRDQQGTAIPGLTAYQVTVGIANSTMPGLPGGSGLLVTVTVSHPGTGNRVVMSGYKLNW